MSYNKYISIVAIAGLLSWIAFVVVIYKLNPDESTGLALTFYFVSLFLALSATFTILGFYLRAWLQKNDLHYTHINISMRQGILLSLVSIGCLVFLLLSILRWWSGLLLIMIATLIELYFTVRA